MNVERLMQDLSIEQLVQIQSSLEDEIEKKKEDLRQMVGRRYRDVLEASNTVKRLTEISDQLVDDLAEMYALTSTAGQRRIDAQAAAAAKKSDVGLPVVHDFVVLSTLLSQVGWTGDSVCDAFCLLLSDAFYRRFAAKAQAIEAVAAAASKTPSTLDASRFSQLILDRLIVAKLEVCDGITESLGKHTDWSTVVDGLLAMALLKQLSMEELMDLYLQARLDAIFLTIKASDTSLTSVIQMLCDTTQTIDDVFGRGEALVGALSTVNVSGWCPDYVRLIIDDQLKEYERLFMKEVIKVNAVYPPEKIQSLSGSYVQEKMCSMTRDRVRAMCDHFERIEQIIEFVDVINQLFKAEWPEVISNLTIYQSLFGDSLIQRCRTLVDGGLATLEAQLLAKLPTCNTNPQPLFQKRVTKFDPLLASGVSHELNALVQELFNGMRDLLANVNKYVAVGREPNVATLQDTLADAVLTLVDRLLVRFGVSQGSECSSVQPDAESCVDGAQKTIAKDRWLSTFRLFLAFIQHEPSMFCQCMNRSAERLARCNRALRHATETALCNYMECVIDECVADSQLHVMPEICAAEHLWLDLIEEYESLPLDEGVGDASISVPTQLSRHYFQFLYAICRQLDANSIGHLFTRQATGFVAGKLGAIFARSLAECAERCSAATPICAQLLFDCKALFLLFMDAQLLDCAHSVEQKMDAFDGRLLAEPLSRNAKLFVQRTSMIFAQLQAETLGAVDVQSKVSAVSSSAALSSTYAALVDITPRVTDVRRLPLIARLSKLRSDDDSQSLVVKKSSKDRRPSGGLGGMGSRNASTNALAASGSVGAAFSKTPSTASFSSMFYDKFSAGGWFNK